MKINTLISGMVSAGILTLSATNALAADGKITFNGSITDVACTVDSSSKDMTVTLGNVSRTSLDGSAGKTAAPVSFNIKLTNCPVAINGKNASVIFDGISANNDNTALKLTQDTGVATGVGVQISDNSGSIVPLFTPSSSYPLVTGVNSLGFTARYVSLTNAVTAGPANAVSNFTIAYN